MPRRITIEPHLTIEELEQSYRKATDAISLDAQNREDSYFHPLERGGLKPFFWSTKVSIRQKISNISQKSVISP